MTSWKIHFEPASVTIDAPQGATLTEAARIAGLEINQPCGGQGRCGRCAVRIDQGESNVRARSTLRLSDESVDAGYVLACQAVVDGDAAVTIPPQEAIARRLTTQKAAALIELPFEYDFRVHQSIQWLPLRLTPPDLTDQTDDWARIRRELAKQGFSDAICGLAVLQTMGEALRQGSTGHEESSSWEVTAVVATGRWDRPHGPVEVLAVLPGDRSSRAYGAAIDIGTTTVTVWLIDLRTGEVLAQAADYNGQIARGEDVISRIIYAKKPPQLVELQTLVLATIDRLLSKACSEIGATPGEILKVTIAGNTTMIHLLLAIPPESIRLAPYIPVVNQTPTLTAGEIGLSAHRNAVVDCLPGVASYVGADISAGVLSAKMGDSSELILFIDVGTNGETVLGNADWMVTCACSAGPAFEGAGVEHGMRATIGAIEDVWISSTTFEPSYRVIGEDGQLPRGICGSGLLALLAELFVTGIIDKRGLLRVDLPAGPDGRCRVREGEHGPEYVVAWPDETESGSAIALNKVDIDNLMRAKAAIYAGFTVMAQSVGVDLADVSQMLIAGSFGQYINVEKAVQIGLLPDLPAPAGSESQWDRFQFLGNTAIRGAYMALLREDVRSRLAEIAGMMTYLELSADNAFYDAFTSALFLPHTDIRQFPSVEQALGQRAS